MGELSHSTLPLNEEEGEHEHFPVNGCRLEMPKAWGATRGCLPSMCLVCQHFTPSSIRPLCHSPILPFTQFPIQPRQAILDFRGLIYRALNKCSNMRKMTFHHSHCRIHQHANRNSSTIGLHRTRSQLGHEYGRNRLRPVSFLPTHPRISYGV